MILSFILISSILSIKFYNIGYAKSKTSNYNQNIISFNDDIKCNKDDSFGLINNYKEKIEVTISKHISSVYYVFTVPYQSYRLTNGKHINIIFYDGNIDMIVGFNSYNAYIEKTGSNNGVYVSNVYKNYIAYAISTYMDGYDKLIYQFDDVSGFVKNIPEGQDEVIYIPISYFDEMINENIVTSDTKLSFKLLFELDKRVVIDDVIRLDNISINAECYDSIYDGIVSSYRDIFSVVYYFLIASALISTFSVAILFCMKINDNKNDLYIKSIYYANDMKIILDETKKNILIYLFSCIISIVFISMINLIIYLTTNIFIGIGLETLIQMAALLIIICIISLVFTKIVIVKNKKI